MVSAGSTLHEDIMGKAGDWLSLSLSAAAQCSQLCVGEANVQRGHVTLLGTRVGTNANRAVALCLPSDPNMRG